MSFIRVADIDDIPVAGSLPVEVGGEPIALVRPVEDTVKAIHNICSHQYYELSPEGWIEDNTIECDLHGSVFDLDTGEPACLPALVAIPVYACKVVDGDVLIDTSQPLNDASPPQH